MFKNFEEMVAFNKETVEAVVAANNAAITGAEKITRAYTDLSKASLDRAVSAAKDLSALKSQEDVFEAQTKLATEGFEQALADTKAIFALNTEVSRDVAAPIIERTNALLALTKVA